MNTWKSNLKWKELPKPEIGDMIILKLSDWVPYSVQVIVTSIVQDQITGVIEAVFDWQTKAEVTGGDRINLKGKEASFAPQYMQDVIKKIGSKSQTVKPEQ